MMKLYKINGNLKSLALAEDFLQVLKSKWLLVMGLFTLLGSNQAFGQCDTASSPSGSCSGFHRVISNIYLKNLYTEQDYQTGAYNDCCGDYSHYGEQGWTFHVGEKVMIGADINDENTCPNLSHSANPRDFVVWLDVDGSGTYDQDELVYYHDEGDYISDNDVDSFRGGFIQIPQTAATGKISMRVMAGGTGEGLATHQSNGACYSGHSTMEYEDYIVTIQSKGLPTAAFNGPAQDTLLQGFTYCFENTSDANVTNKWSINSQQVSTDEDFQYTPTSTGGKNITLAVSNSEGNDAVSQSYYVKNPPQKAPVANFSVSSNVVDRSPNEVNFRDISENGPTEWDWTFTPANPTQGTQYAFPSIGGTCSGIPNSDTADNPAVHFLQEATIYDVCLKASNPYGTDSVCREDYLYVRDIVDGMGSQNSSGFPYGRIYDNGGAENDYGNNVSSDFLINTCKRTIINFESFELEEGDHLRIYDGQDASGEPLWDASEHGENGFTGSLEAGDVPPQVTAESGYAYIEFETDGSGTASGFNLTWLTQEKHFDQPVASFQGPSTVCPGEAVNFSNTSENGVSYQWDTTGSNARGMVSEGKNLEEVTFPYSGTWDLSLVAENCTGADTITKQIQVQPANQAPAPGFEASDFNMVVGETTQLTDTTQGCVDFRDWEFSPGVEFVEGDTGSLSPEVRFLQPGCHEVTLHVGNSNDTVSHTMACYFDVQCAPTVTDLNPDLGISRVQLESIENISSIGETGFTSYYQQDEAAHIEVGEQHELKISRNTAYNEMDLKVWMDLDGDQDFDESHELITHRQNKRQQYTVQFVLPDTVARGDARMRIGTALNGLSNTPCGSNQYGEFEDYKLEITDDVTPPVIHFQGNKDLSIQACASLGMIDTGTYAMDNVDGRLNNVQRLNSIDSSVAGTDTLFYEVTDAAGNTATAYRIVEILQDRTDPEGTLSGNDTVTAHVNASYSDAGYDAASVSDNCSGINRVEAKDNVNTGALGIHTYQYHIIDNAGNEEVLTRYVRVVDTMKPSIQLNGSNPYHVGLNSTFEDPGIDTVFDNYWESTAIEVSVSGYNDINTSSLDTFDVIYQAKDGSGNVRQVVRQIIVEDQTAPEIGGELSDGDTVVQDVGTVLDLNGQLTVTDNSGEVERSFSGNYAAALDAQNRAQALGLYSGDVVYSDVSGNQSSISLNIDVVDRIAPEIELVGPRTVTLGQWDSTDYASIDSVMVTDNHGIMRKEADTASSYFTDYLTGSHPSGFYEIRYVAEDSAGNTASEVRYVDVQSTSIGNDEADEAMNLEVYPNPSNGVVNVELDSDNLREGRISIMNATGQEVKQVAEGELEGHYRLDLSKESGGVYFLRLDNEETVQMKRFVIVK